MLSFVNRGFKARRNPVSTVCGYIAALKMIINHLFDLWYRWDNWWMSEIWSRLAESLNSRCIRKYDGCGCGQIC